VAGTRRRLVASAAVGLLPFAIIPVASRSLSHRVGEGAAVELVNLGQSVAELAKVIEPEPLPPTPEGAAIAALGDPVATPSARSAASGTPGPSKECTAPTEACGFPKPVGVFVSRARVLAAARAGLRPTGSSVPATSWRPAGLALSGVSGLGVGLRDGDVLISAGGPATSEAAVVGAVIAALRARSRAMSGVAWRGRQRIDVTVELPDLVVDDGAAERETARPR
jgi:hypothetical protein